MTGLRNTDLTTSQEIESSAKTLANRGLHERLLLKQLSLKKTTRKGRICAKLQLTKAATLPTKPAFHTFYSDFSTATAAKTHSKLSG